MIRHDDDDDWRIEMVFNVTENYKLSHNHNILFSLARWTTIEMHFNSPQNFGLNVGDNVFL